jgi:hypothetical protein
MSSSSSPIRPLSGGSKSEANHGGTRLGLLVIFSRGDQIVKVARAENLLPDFEGLDSGADATVQLSEF